MSHEDWAKAVDDAIQHFEQSPRVLQRYHKPALVEAQWFDFAKNEVVPMKGRVRLCPYYFVAGEGDAARPQLGGVLATIIPADKKIIHGMSRRDSRAVCDVGGNVSAGVRPAAARTRIAPNREFGAAKPCGLRLLKSAAAIFCFAKPPRKS